MLTSLSTQRNKQHGVITVSNKQHTAPGSSKGWREMRTRANHCFCLFIFVYFWKSATRPDPPMPFLWMHLKGLSGPCRGMISSISSYLSWRRRRTGFVGKQIPPYGLCENRFLCMGCVWQKNPASGQDWQRTPHLWCRQHILYWDQRKCAIHSTGLFSGGLYKDIYTKMRVCLQ